MVVAFFSVMKLYMVFIAATVFFTLTSPSLANYQPTIISVGACDFGEKIDLGKIPVPKLPPDKGGGLGIHFMKTMMDEFEFKTSHRDGNELVMAKYKKK